jgi:predicted component of type VI protein secretion system
MPDFYKKIAYKANRKGIVELFTEPSTQKNVQCDLDLMKTLDKTIADIELYITRQTGQRTQPE